MTPEQLKNVTPAPWIVDAPGCVGHHFKEGGKRTIAIPGRRGAAWPEDEADAEFIALARNAEDVMMRRGWSPVKSPLANEGWRVDMDDGCYFAYGREDSDVQSAHWHHPFVALVEADKWYKANVGEKSA